MSNLTPCPVDGCANEAEFHHEKFPADTVHHRPQLEYPAPTTIEWPMRISIVTYDAIAPHWRLVPDIWSTSEDLTSEQVHYMALELELNATYVRDLNDAIDHASESAA
jgi:hypothetical protein